MSHGYEVEAVYEDGFVLREDSAGTDESPYDPGRNTFHAILSGKAVAEHGRMVRWALIPTVPGQDQAVVDWRELWARGNARPVYWRDMTKTFRADGADSGPVCEAHHFGYQYTDQATGRNVQHVRVLKPPTYRGDPA
jgi:hypothetical protein